MLSASEKGRISCQLALGKNMKKNGATLNVLDSINIEKPISTSVR